MIQIPCLTEKQTTELVEAAEQVALRFCCPVYLVGSAIDYEYPNDIDIYIACTGDTYIKLFTNYNKKTESEEDHIDNIRAMKIQQAKIYQKQKIYFEDRIKGWDFDIKFQNIDQFLQHEGNSIRLDYVYKTVW